MLVMSFSLVMHTKGLGSFSSGHMCRAGVRMGPSSFELVLNQELGPGTLLAMSTLLCCTGFVGAQRTKTPQQLDEADWDPSEWFDEGDWDPPDWRAEEQRAEWMHQVTAFQLDPSAFAVRDAGNKGKGLFATRTIQRGMFLFDYTGAIQLEDEYDASPEDESDYACAIDNAAGTTFVIDAADAADTRSNLARYMNHDASPDATCLTMRDAYRYGDRDDMNAAPPALHIFTNREVDAGEELCWDYGQEYWNATREGEKLWLKESKELEALAAMETKEIDRGRASLLRGGVISPPSGRLIAEKR